VDAAYLRVTGAAVPGFGAGDVMRDAAQL